MLINAKRTLFGALTGMFLGGMTATTAVAVPLDQVEGSVSFKFFAGSTSQNTFTNGGACGVGSGCENTWLGATLTQIVSNTTLLPVFNQGENGQFLSAMLYGVSDISIVPGGTNGFEIYSAGATGAGTGGVGDGLIHLDVYLRDTAPDLSGGPADRTGYGTYNGVSEGSSVLWLSLVLVPGIASDDPSTLVDESAATLFQDASSATNPAQGDGIFFADVTGGIAAAQFDGNGFLIPNTGAFADMRGHFEFHDNAANLFEGIPGCTAGINPSCWENFVADPILALTAVPEPETVGLTGLALLMLAGARYRRRRS